MTAAAARQDRGRRRASPWLTLDRREALEAWLFVSPVLVGFVVVFVGPLAAVVYYTMTEWNLLTQQMTWVGLANYKHALSENPDFWHVLRNSAVFAFGLVPLNMALA